MIILWIIIFIFVIIILILSLALLFFIKKSLFLHQKEIEFILFTLEMYLKYSNELDIDSKEQHEIIVKELNKIKNKLEKELLKN